MALPQGGLGQSISAASLPGPRNDPGAALQWRPESRDRVSSAASGMRPASRMSAEASRPASQMGKSASASQFRKGLAKLPPLSPTSTQGAMRPKSRGTGTVAFPISSAPLTFEDLYKIAKGRAVKKLAEQKKTMAKELRKMANAAQEGSPTSPDPRLGASSGGARKSWFFDTGDGPTAADQERQKQEDEWAASALKVMLEAEKGRENEELNEVSAQPLTSSTSEAKGDSEPQEEEAEVNQEADQSASEKLSEEIKIQRKPSRKLTRQESGIASQKYISAIRKAIAGESRGTLSAGSLLDFGSIDELGLQDHSTAMTRHAAEGFSEDELNRMRVAFRRFKSTEGSEIHVNELQEALHHLGYMKSDNEEAIKELVAIVSGFSTLDWQEFVDFLEKFAQWEKEQLKILFDGMDENGSGTLDLLEVRNILSQMGITPLRATLDEGREIVDFDGSGEFDFEEFVHLLAVYRVTEGFTRKEVKNLRLIFDRVAIVPPGRFQPEIESNMLKDALAHWFGPQAAALATKLEEKLQSYTQELDEHSELRKTDVTSGMGGLKFPEFLVWARRLRELEIEEYKEHFARWQEPGKDYLEEPEMMKVIMSLGYMPLQKMVNEVLDICDSDRDGTIDFDEFVNFMEMYRQSDGFSKQEVIELEVAFDRFKSEDEEQVSCLELMEVFRSLGYVTSLDAARRYIKEVDFDNSNALDFREFLRLMRLHREEELKEVQEVYEAFKDKVKPFMKPGLVKGALDKLGYTPTELVIQEALNDCANQKEILFDDFVSIVDHSRRASMAVRRMRAGFSDEEVERYAKAFAVYDEDGNGDIERHELTKLLQDLDIPMRTVDDQKGMLAMLDSAREAAQRAGVEESLIGSMGSPAITFHTLLHLVRMMKRADDKKEVDRDNDLMQKLNFAPKEVIEFQDVFEFWAKQPAVHAQTDKKGGQADMENVQPQQHTTKAGAIAKAESDGVTFLTDEGVGRVVRSLGLALTKEQKLQLEDKVKEVGDEEARVFFPAFLSMMRWMLDENFGGVNDAVAGAAAPSSPPQQQRTESADTNL